LKRADPTLPARSLHSGWGSFCLLAASWPTPGRSPALPLPPVLGHCCGSSASPHLEAALDPAQARVRAVELFLDPGDPADKALEFPPHLDLVGLDPLQGFEHGVFLFIGHGANPAWPGLGIGR
jgi:hypothetical protein